MTVFEVFQADFSKDSKESQSKNKERKAKLGTFFQVKIRSTMFCWQMQSCDYLINMATQHAS